MTTKYTRNGRKVALIEELNPGEMIVQEVHVFGIEERPSGKKFTVRTAELLDAPPPTWAETRTKEMEEAYARTKARCAEAEKALVARREEVRAHMEYAGAVLKNASPRTFDLLVRFLTGGIKWAVTLGITPRVVEWGHGTYEGRLRLLSVFGKDDGTMSFVCSRYCDGSDYNHGEEFVPCDTREEAVAEWLRAVGDHVDDAILNLAAEYGATLPAAAVAAWRAKKVIAAEKAIASARGAIALQEEIIRMNSDDAR